jgi:polar amino acid transport system permease protein
MLEEIHDIADFALPLVKSAGVTIAVTVGAAFVALMLGFLLAAIRLFFPGGHLRRLIQIYIEVFRNVPSLTHLFIIYFGLAYVGIRLGSITAAILGLGLIGAAVTTEIFRAGFEAIPKGQREAALAVGLTPFQAFRHIVFPQSLRISLPPIANYVVQLVKDTSLVAAIAAPEIMFTARNLVVNTFETTLVYTLAALLYLVICLPISRAIRRLEARVAFR